MRLTCSVPIFFGLALAFVTILQAATLESDWKPRTRVVGGRYARKDEIPYIVALYRYPGYDADQFCGGSIFSKKFIITAAHCLFKIGYKVQPKIPEFKIIAGTVDHKVQSAAAASPSVQVINVKKYVTHPGFAATADPKLKYVNDIAVLELEKSLEYNSGVQPIPIPPSGTVSSGKATLSGWGETGINNLTGNRGEKSDKLITLDLIVVPRDICDKYYTEIPKKYAALIKEKMVLPVPSETVMCAGLPEEDGKDACHGDSGGPLQCSRKVGDKVEKYLCGIVSYSFGCGLKIPGLYTDVAQFHDWIIDNTKE